jgi:lipopolysaccharide export system ATP-binding protein
MKLRTDNIKKSYKGRQVVKGVSVEVNQGEIVGLLGPNGAGKTTSFYMIVGLISPNEGKVFLDDTEITRFAMFKRAQLGIGYLPQEVSVFRKMSVEDNIMTVLEMTKRSKEERLEKLESLLDEFGLQHVRKNLGQSLSGGEKRRTEIARALATNPKFILLDEPFAGVDPIAVEDIQQIVAKLKKKNIGVLITDHNVQETLSITDRTYLLFEGSILREGTAEALASDEMVRKVYLGANFELRKKSYDNVDGVEKSVTKDAQKEKDAVKYAERILHTAKQLQNKLSGSFLNVEALNDSEDLESKLKEMKAYFLDYDLGNRAQEIYKNLQFGPAARYKSRFSLLFYLLIPVIGWTLLVMARNRRKDCLDALDKLITNLSTFQMLLDKPDLEEMIE